MNLHGNLFIQGSYSEGFRECFPEILSRSQGTLAPILELKGFPANAASYSAAAFLILPQATTSTLCISGLYAAALMIPILFLGEEELCSLNKLALVSKVL